MARNRRTFDPAFKAKVAAEALKERHSLSELAARFELQPNTISLWKQRAIDYLPNAFQDGRKKEAIDNRQALESELYQQIGQLKMEVEWLKKKSNQRP